MWIAGLIVLGVVFLAGLWLLLTGLRGRVVDDHPVCRKCKFDLVGVYPGVGCCPECGGKLEEQAVRIGQRVRRRMRIVGGVLGVAAALLVGAGMFVTMTSAVNWNAYLPTRVLIWRLETSTPTGTHAAVVELSKRLNQDDLSSHQIRRLVEAGLLVQGDPSRPWDTALGDLIEVLDLKGELESEQSSLYWRQGIESSVLIRKKVRPGQPTILAMRNETRRCGMGTRILVEPFVETILLDGKPAYERASNAGSSYGVMGGAGGTLTSGFKEQIPLEPGENHLLIAWRVRVYRSDSYARSEDNLVSEWTETKSVAVRVVPEPEPLVRWVRDPEVVEQVQSCVSIDRFEGQPWPGDEFGVTGYIRTEGLAVPMAFDVILLVNGQEQKLYSQAIFPGSGIQIWGGIGSLEEKVVDGELILRPSEDALGTLNVDEVFGEELRFPVTISWPEKNVPKMQDANKTDQANVEADSAGGG